MKKTIFIPLCIVTGVLLGLAALRLAGPGHPVLPALMDQQDDILQGQRRLEAKINKLLPVQAGVRTGEGASLEARLRNVEQKISQLEKNLAALKKQGVAAARPSRPKEDYTTVHAIPRDHSAIIGQKDAPVTIVEFVDFQCPYCARFHEPVEEVVEKHPKKVNLMIKNFPLAFHKNALSAAKAALAAGEQGKYGEMATLLLKNGRNLNEEKYKELAESLGLNVKKFMKDYEEKDAVWEELINKDKALGAKVGVRGTPTFFLNGRKTRARDVASFEKEIDAAIKEKK